MANKKTLKVFSTATIAGMMAAAVLSSQAFAAVNSYSVKVGDNVYKYEKTELTKAFLQAKTGEKSALYDDFTAKLSEAKGFYAFEDSKNGFVDYSAIQAKFLEAKADGKTFDVDAFAESKDAKVIEIATVKKAVVNKDGKVEYKEETVDGDKDAEVSVKSVEALNLKQVKISFNKAVKNGDKKDDIEDKGNYTWEDKDGNEVKQIVDKVELDESGRFAILTFRDEFNGNHKFTRSNDSDKDIQNQEKYTLTVDENVLGKDTEYKVEFKDLEMPKIEGIEAVGIRTIKVKFSEPIQPTEYDNDKKVAILDKDYFELNKEDISIDRVELVNNNTEANIILGSKLKDNQKVNVYVKGKVQDYAGYGVVSEKKDIKVKENTEKPTVVGFKNVKKGEVTLIFNQDIKFKNEDTKVKPADWFKNGKLISDDDAKKNNVSKTGDKDFYHTNDENKAYAIKIDGNELTLYFDEDKNGLPNGTAYINIASETIETLWEKKNDKIVAKVERPEDKVKPLIKKVEQDEDVASKIKVKFSKELGKKEAEDQDNYTLKDEKGKEWRITNAHYENDDKEVTLTISKDLDAGEYKLTVKDVEDKSGNAIEKITKKFNATEKDARENSDLTANVYDAGKSDQKIVLDFDTKMKTGKVKGAIDDLSKYTLVALNKVGEDNEGKPIYEEVKGAFKNDKSSVSVDTLYNATIRPVENGKKIEIKLPCKDKDNSYDFTKKNDKYNNGENPKYKAFDTLQLRVGKVSDIYDNINSTTIKTIVKDSDTVKVKSKDGAPLVRAISTNKIQVTFKDDIDFYNEDITLVYGDDVTKDNVADKIKSEENNVIKVSSWEKEVKDGKAVVTMTLSDQTRAIDNIYDKDEDHILNYDGTFTPKKTEKVQGKNGEEVVQVGPQKVHVVIGRVIKDKDHEGKYILGETKSKNKYDAKLETGIHQVLDNIAPALVDNSKRSKEDKVESIYVGNNVYNNIDEKKNEVFLAKNVKNDQAVEYYRKDGSDIGAIVLTFEEKLDTTSVSKNTFILDRDKDYKYVQVADIKAQDNKVIIVVKGLNEIQNGAKFGDGFDVIQNAPISDVAGDKNINRGLGNQVEGIKAEIGGFGQLKINDIENQYLVAEIQKLEKEAEENAAVKVINETKANKIAKVIETNAKILGLDLTDYNNLKEENKVKVSEVLVGKKFADKKDVKKVFDDAVKTQKQAEVDQAAAADQAAVNEKIKLVEDSYELSKNATDDNKIKSELEAEIKKTVKDVDVAVEKTSDKVYKVTLTKEGKTAEKANVNVTIAQDENQKAVNEKIKLVEDSYQLSKNATDDNKIKLELEAEIKKTVKDVDVAVEKTSDKVYKVTLTKEGKTAEKANVNVTIATK